MIDSYAEFNAMKRVLADYDLQLKMDKKCRVPYTSGKTVVMPPLPYDASKDDKIKWLGIGYHEAGHHAAETKDIWSLIEDKKISMDSLFGRVINIIEDVRDEQNKLGYYRGRDSALSEMNGLVVSDCVKNFETKTEPDDEEWKLTKAIQGWSLDYRSHWQPHVALPGEQFRKHCDPELLAKLSPLKSRLSTDSLVRAEDTYRLAKDVLDALGVDSKKEEEKAKAKGEKEAKEAGKRRRSRKKDGKSSAGVMSYKDLMGHDHAEASKDKKEGYSVIEYDHDWSGHYTPHTNLAIRKPKRREMDPAKQELYDSGVKLSGTVKRLFQGMSQTRHEYYKREGKLSTRDLYRVPTGSVDVFKKKYATLDPTGVAVCLMVDASGSMFGCTPDRFDYAAAASSLLVDALMPLNIPVLVSTFSESSYSIDHCIMKDFNQRLTGLDVLRNFSGYTTASVQNADGDSVLWAYRQLMSRSEHRKILIVLSDGQPCCDNPGDAARFLKDVVRNISKQVEVYAIGIQTEDVKSFYPEYSVLMETEELEKCLLNVVKRKLL